ncbi:microsomal glutathione S-transferase 1 [Varanus komodoensis]|uniref:Microsomal glutathione S-transferase 1 n=1 Tax=Varanus komodoensis TaxID=61221 RepID=A0A8D2L2R2_VARKO|nr:microsomal glutathione S-transferase 1 [Varanus komodoensis]XP_044311503.1 microsomal glutathione S-transferase 1 [Varanus komodoensis]XP_044311504.1 microsomal glutathione S-transferase 1 [Varanus komodoensis]
MAEGLDLNKLVDREVVLAYVRYAVPLVVKMMLISVITAFFRMKKKAFVNPEDTASFGKGENAKKFLRTDPDVERVRRIHLNDLENIVPFLFIGLFYSASGISLSTALLHYRVFLGSRILHTIAYLVPLPQPCRALSWMVGYAVTFSMIYRLVVLGLSMS